MNSQNPLRRSDNEATLRAWQSEIARSAEAPWLVQVLAARVTDLLPRVARCHAQLRTLPRRTRRAWQRQLARSSDLPAILEQWSQRRTGRALQRQLARSVVGAALLLALTHGVGHAATITVDTNKPGINPDGKCSLIEAIVNANDDAATYPDCTAGSGADIIVLPKATHTLGAVYDTTYDYSGLPLITSQITIEGHDAKITRKGGATPAFRLIAVGATGDLTLKDVTLSGGKAALYGGAIHSEGVLTIQNSTISGNDAGYAGGGITTYGGTLTIENSTISGNTAAKGYPNGEGGGILVYSGTVTITNSTISGNQAAGALVNYGGGITNRGSMTIDNSTVSNNKAGGVYAIGGGITNSGDLTITNSTISGNQARGAYANNGGGIYNIATLTIQNSTISGNKANKFGLGGGIQNYGPATIENSTISGNKAGTKYGAGGGIINASALTITNSTISGNKAAGKYGYGGGILTFGAVTLHRSLISGNKAAEGPEVDDPFGSVTADDFNLFGVSGNAGTSFSPGPTDIVPDVALAKILGALAANGGPTKTRALKPGSPAVNAVPFSDPACTGTDQRGVTRPQPPGSNCDIGAFELE